MSGFGKLGELCRTTVRTCVHRRMWSPEVRGRRARDVRVACHGGSKFCKWDSFVGARIQILVSTLGVQSEFERGGTLNERCIYAEELKYIVLRARGRVAQMSFAACRVFPDKVESRYLLL